MPTRQKRLPLPMLLCCLFSAISQADDASGTAAGPEPQLELSEPVTVAMAPPEVKGWGPFGTRMDPKREGTTGQIAYTTKGKVQAYVQFKQLVPQGFERLSLWPAELYDQIAPPKNPQHSPIGK